MWDVGQMGKLLGDGIKHCNPWKNTEKIQWCQGNKTAKKINQYKLYIDVK